MLPKNWGIYVSRIYIFGLDIFANNWGIYVNWRVSVPYRIFVTGTTVGTRGKNLSCGEI